MSYVRTHSLTLWPWRGWWGLAALSIALRNRVLCDGRSIFRSISNHSVHGSQRAWGKAVLLTCCFKDVPCNVKQLIQ